MGLREIYRQQRELNDQGRAFIVSASVRIRAREKDTVTRETGPTIQLRPMMAGPSPGVDLGNGSYEASLSLFLFLLYTLPRISKLRACYSTATNCLPRLNGPFTPPTDQTTHRRQITSLTATAILA